MLLMSMVPADSALTTKLPPVEVVVVVVVSSSLLHAPNASAVATMAESNSNRFIFPPSRIGVTIRSSNVVWDSR